MENRTEVINSLGHACFVCGNRKGVTFIGDDPKNHILPHPVHFSGGITP